MSWLRIDDGFDTHPKMLELTEQQRWRWTRVLIHCAKHHTEGHIKESVLRELGLEKSLPKLITTGLLHENGAGYVVHDWRIYNGDTIAEKVAAFLENNPDATANEVYKGIGGKRELVLKEVGRLKESGGSPPDTQVVPGTTEGTEGELVPDRFQSGSRARGPVPRPPLDQEQGSSVSKGSVGVRPPARDAFEPAPLTFTVESTDFHIYPKAEEQLGHDRYHEFEKLMLCVTKQDEKTPEVVAALCKKLPLSRIAIVREVYETKRAPAGKIVNALKGQEREYIQEIRDAAPTPADDDIPF